MLPVWGRAHAEIRRGTPHLHSFYHDLLGHDSIIPLREYNERRLRPRGGGPPGIEAPGIPTRKLVNGDNAAALAKLPDVDGFLVGSASLSPTEFHGICVQAANAVKETRSATVPSAMKPTPSGYTGTELALAREAGKRPDSTAWRLQLALAAYRVIGFQCLESQAMLCERDGSLPENYPDLLRDEIWRRRVSVTARLFSAIREGKIRGVASAGEWMAATDDSLKGEDKCRALARERATAAAAIAYKTAASKQIDEETFREIYEAGYLAADADTRNRHWMRRGVDEKTETATGF